MGIRFTIRAHPCFQVADPMQSMAVVVPARGWGRMCISLRLPGATTQYVLPVGIFGRLRLAQVSDMKKNGFTLIELIIVVVIIGILALIAIPKYFANVEKAKKSQVYANLKIIRDAVLAYYAINGIYPSTWITTVILDGDTIYNVSNPDPTNTHWRYGWGPDLPGTCTDGRYVYAYKEPGDTCWMGVCVVSGNKVGTCP